MADDKKQRRPRPEREPQIPTASRYDTVTPIRAIIEGLEGGYFYGASRLIRQMWQNPRLRVAVSTRLAGHIGAEERWTAARDSKTARAALEAIREDWPAIISTATRKQQGRWGLLLGCSFAQPHWYVSRSTGREIPRVEVYDPSSCRWDDHRGVYVVMPRDSGEVLVNSPAVCAPDELTPGWIVHEPFGKQSFKDGYVHSAWYPWLGNNLASRDRLRTSEKVGEDTLLAEIPFGADKQAASDFVTGLRSMKSGAVVPLEIREGEGGELIKFNVRPLEWTANGYQVVDQTVAATAVDLIILFLGGNLQTEVKSGGSHGAADSQGEVRADYIDDDAKGETNTLHMQVVRQWAEANFGDPDDAPIREVVSDPPAKDAAAATMVSQVSQSLDNLARHGVDTAALCERFRLPMVTQGKAQVSVPAQVEGEPAPAADTDPAPTPDAPAAEASVAATPLDITPTDVAAIATVDEGRKSRGLDPIGGDMGARWIVEHSAKVKAEAAPAIAEAAQAEQGRADAPPAPAEATP